MRHPLTLFLFIGSSLSHDYTVFCYNPHARSIHQMVHHRTLRTCCPCTAVGVLACVALVVLGCGAVLAIAPSEQMHMKQSKAIPRHPMPIRANMFSLR